MHFGQEYLDDKGIKSGDSIMVKTHEGGEFFGYSGRIDKGRYKLYKEVGPPKYFEEREVKEVERI